VQRSNPPLPGVANGPAAQPPVGGLLGHPLPNRDNCPRFRRPAAGEAIFRASPVALTKEEERELRLQLARLQQEHRDLDAAIAALQDSPGRDILQVQRLKKRKLHLRDRIAFIEDQLFPDIIA
jgi:hypothetical protein